MGITHFLILFSSAFLETCPGVEKVCEVAKQLSRQLVCLKRRKGKKERTRNEEENETAKREQRNGKKKKEQKLEEE